MTRKTTTLLASAAMALGLSATATLADAWHEDWDSDGDGMLSQQEWNAGLDDNEVFDGYDANADGALDEDEWGEDLVDLDGSVDDTFNMDEDSFAESSYDAYDANDDGMLDGEELGAVDDGFYSNDEV